jgi:DNA-binding protein
MNYVLAVVTQFNGGSPTVVIRARGNAISRAVDVAELARHKFVEKCTVEGVRIGTERVTNERNRSVNVSTIEIHLAKQA